MKRIRIVGLCLIAVFALSAVASSAASAAPPEFFTCVKAVPKNTGNYTEKECFTKASPAGTGKYERASAVGIKDTSKTKT
jgi:hypothetical protein